jgi:TonB family protein
VKTFRLVCVAMSVLGMVGGGSSSLAQNASQDPGAAKAPAGDVAQPLLVKRVDPVYPGGAFSNQVDGDVVMKATIAVDGTVTNIKVAHGLPQLLQPAVHAVSQWQYQPYRVNGVATPFDTTIVVHFKLSKSALSAASPPPVQGEDTGALQPAQRPQLPPPPAGVMRISGRVMAGNLESRIEPVYPPDAVALDARGSVLLLATIKKTGEVSDAQVVSGPERFRSAAMDAVKQWRYHPYEVDGAAVDVQTTITLNFAPSH